ncbi:MAG: tRNA lysidine(34) synthetase TilS [Micavibrio sp.]|nr:tRNA lysidine(34) synthetase TilS [Micavibrio sp.]
MSQSLLHSSIADFFELYIPESSSVRNIAIAVSGGADSLALAHLLNQKISSDLRHVKLHVLTVDHGLRPEASGEAEHVGNIVSSWENATHQILKWDGRSAETGIQEKARNARYDLMREYCEQHGIKHLFLGHHGGDQFETFFIRLSAGSGPEGLGCMSPVSDLNGLSLCRPLLYRSHEDLISNCQKENIVWCEDPSNGDDKYERVRYRKAYDVLSSEGLTYKRLNKTLERVRQMAESANVFSNEKYDDITIKKETDRILFDLKSFKSLPFDTACRIIRKAIEEIATDGGYGPRTEKTEILTKELLADKDFRKRTLGKCIFEILDDGEKFSVSKE